MGQKNKKQNWPGLFKQQESQGKTGDQRLKKTDAMKSGPCLQQLEKALAQKQRPDTAINK